MMKAPTSVPTTLPSPPRKLPPPITTAAIACNSYPCPGRRLPGHQPRGLDHSGKSGQQSADGIDRSGVEGNRNARIDGRRRSCCRWQMHNAPAGCAPAECAPQPRRPPAATDERNTEQVAFAEEGKAGGILCTGRPLEIISASAAKNAKCSQRHDERRNLQAGDQNAVQETADQARDRYRPAHPLEWKRRVPSPWCRASPPRPRIEPTERSMPPEMMMIVMPSAMMLITAVWRTTLERLLA